MGAKTIKFIFKLLFFEYTNDDIFELIENVISLIGNLIVSRLERRNECTDTGKERSDKKAKSRLKENIQLNIKQANINKLTINRPNGRILDGGRSKYVTVNIDQINIEKIEYYNY